MPITSRILTSTRYAPTLEPRTTTVIASHAKFAKYAKFCSMDDFANLADFA